MCNTVRRIAATREFFHLPRAAYIGNKKKYINTPLMTDTYLYITYTFFCDGRCVRRGVQTTGCVRSIPSIQYSIRLCIHYAS